MINEIYNFESEFIVLERPSEIENIKEKTVFDDNALEGSTCFDKVIDIDVD